MILKKFFCLIISILFFNVVCFAKMQSFVKEATEIVPPNQSQDQVINYLTQKLTREATEEAGTFITSNLQIDSYEITKDKVNKVNPKFNIKTTKNYFNIGSPIKETKAI